MAKLVHILFLGSFLLFAGTNIYAQDSLTFKGQLSGWALYNGGLDLPVNAGGRYIPQVNYEYKFGKNYKIDFEASANINGNFGLHPFDTINRDGQLKPYRLWARFSTNQLEIRAGLQKINFGSASMLRPLMWFDQMDARDPLNLTDGVWGVLGRYYFLNNANIWLWALYGNNDPKGWEMSKTKSGQPEFGGRLQAPFSIGEAALSYHHRISNTKGISNLIPEYDAIQENRIGFDVKVDLIVGAWLEGSWTNNNEDLGAYTNQEVLNAGIDYTFGIGNGLLLTYEQMLASSDQKAFSFEKTTTFSLMSLSYPIGIFDNISGIIYYDWTNKNIYNFINWQKTINNFSMYLMAFWNPDIYSIPTQNFEQNLFAGKGIQVMLVFNH